MTFHELAEVFLLINKESSRIKITELLAAVFSRATAREAQDISYLSLGTVRAPYLGTQFNFAEKSMLKVLAALYHEEPKEYEKRVKKIGDLGLAVLTSEWPYKGKHLTVEEVYNRLVKLQAISGTGSQEEKSALVTTLLKEVDVVSASYIIRIILGTLRLGFSDMTLIDAFSWMLVGNKSLHDAIEHAYNVCADIGLIAYQLKAHGIEAIRTIHPTLGIPIRPAAAERAASAEEIIKRIGPCVAQPKLDGFRLQIHIDTTHAKMHFWFYSRNLQDMSHMFPDLRAALKDVKADTLIMEGEAIVFDENTQTFLPFQETVKRKRKHDIEEVVASLPLRLFLFDLLYLNGKSILEKSHEERRERLKKLFTHYPHSAIQVIEERACKTAQELKDYFNEEIEHGLEGIIAKRPEAPYQPGKRNFNWIKLKRVAGGHLSDTIDAVVLGYYAGRGKRASFGIGAFLVGVYNKEKDRFETVAKVGTGLTDEEWRDLKARCDAKAVPQQPKNVVCAPALTPDVWVEPSIVVVILADEISQSPLHTAGRTETKLGLALRFPRFMGYSVDKTPTEATTIEEIRRLYEEQFK
jgi:DNA ligase 1